MDTQEEVKALWKLCFDDSEDFVDLYFRKRFTENNNYALERNGKIVCAFQMLPYSLLLDGGELPTVYGSGLCTHPDFRNQGLARTLINDIFQDLYKKGIMLKTLIPAEPWLANYYRSMGYEFVFDFVYEPLSIDDIQPDSQVVITEHRLPSADTFCYFDKKQRQRNGVILHSLDDYMTIQEDLFLDGGTLLTIHHGGVLVGLALQRPWGDNEVVINELFADTSSLRTSLIHKIRHIYPNRTIKWMRPLQESSQHNPQLHLGMARLINVSDFLDCYAMTHPNEKFSFKLTDKQLPSNNGYYLLNNGRCTKSAIPLEDAPRDITINQLAHILLQPKRLYMSLMLN